MKISFLGSAHGMPACKTYRGKTVQSYPLIKTFDSFTHEFDDSMAGLEIKLKLLREYAARGFCISKNPVIRDLVKEPRKGAIDKDALTSNIILDVDGIFLPNTALPPVLRRDELQSYAETIIASLPEHFRNVSYIVHASSSMGLKGNKVSLHMDFLLSRPVSPGTLKQYLVYLNFKTPIFCSQFELSASGTALHFPLDRCLADNSRLIYIANPVFTDRSYDPIVSADDRLFLVHKSQTSLDLVPHLTDKINSSENARLIAAKVTELRTIQGLPRRTEKVKTIQIEGRTVHVVTNPDFVKMTPVEDRGAWVTYNVNDGDSAAYYVNKLNPTIVYNFKEEPNFLFEQADPEQYQRHLETYVLGNTDLAKNEPVLLPVVFRDYATNSYYNGLFNAVEGQMFSINKAGREGLADFMVQYGAIIPDNIPIWNYVFEPHNPVSLDFRTRFINKYVPSQLMREGAQMPTDYRPLCYKDSFRLEDYCPAIFTLIYHIVGSSMQEYLHFVNWFATAIQTRRKTSTAWILQGVQGTGKGMFFEKIVAPLVGQGIDKSYPYYIKLRQTNIEDQFNQWEESALFAAIDEFRLNDSDQSHKLFNKIKNMISDEENTVRGMRENTRRVKLYTNYLIYANDEDMISVPQDDRRLNIAPRQTVKLERVFPDLHTTLNVTIPLELPMFAQVLKDFIIDEVAARTALQNDAKRVVREASTTSVEEFMEAIKTGNLDYFLPILDTPYSTPGLDYSTPAKLILKRILSDWEIAEKPIFKMTTDQIRVLYSCMVGRSDNISKFGKLLARYGLRTKNMRIGKTTKVGLEIHWTLNFHDYKELQEEYCADVVSFPRNVIPMKAQES